MKQKTHLKVMTLVLCGILLSILIIVGGTILVTQFPKYNGYLGDYPELFSMAINNLIGAKGGISSEITFPPVLEVIEEDFFGRKLFCYYESDDTGVCLLISQKAESGYVYFYPDCNFIAAPLVAGNKVDLHGTDIPSTIDNPLNDFKMEEINKLKELNDWNKELREDKMAKAAIRTKKEDIDVNENFLREIYSNWVKDENGFYNYYEPFITDEYGRMIIRLIGNRKINDNYERKDIIVILQPDGKCNENIGIMDIDNYYNYQQELKEFKERNDFGKPQVH